jgi:pimeloyl-ACP methyl ester carboxylesterase
VKRAIETREAVRVPIGGIQLCGTYHKPAALAPGQPAAMHGLLFLNHGFLPRAAPGDSAVYWSDCLAQSGYPCFRFDLPGLGDSEGAPSSQMLEIVNKGGYAPAVSALVTELVARFRLPGIVIVGHCAGAVTALFAAPATEGVKGLVLTDPYFFLPLQRTKLRVGLSRWSSWSRLGAFVSSLYYFAKHVRLLLPPNRLPRNANLPLLRRWKQAAAAIPVLVLKAPSLKANGLKPRIGEFDYLAYAQSQAPDARVSVQLIENTNHSFADIRGREAVRTNLEQWLSRHFPASDSEQRLKRSPFTAREAAYQAASPR